VKSVIRRLRAGNEPALFSALEDPRSEALVTDVEGGDVKLYRCWLTRGEADALLAEIRDRAVWVQERRKMYDRFVDVPRQHDWFGDDREKRWPPRILEVQQKLESLTGAHFSHVLLNRYRNGQDSVAWHNDHDVERLPEPVIGSLTLGATRAFDLRPKAARGKIISIDLEHGDLLVMRGETQRYWEHRVAKDLRIAGERINLTFRQVSESMSR
jgi:alkylated DNA repair dioxygenase AlkB